MDKIIIKDLFITCPCCGNIAYRDNSIKDMVEIYCIECGLMIREKDKEVAIKKWNTRVHLK